MITTFGQLKEMLDQALDEAKELIPGAMLTGAQLAKGMVVTATYNTHNSGTEVIEILGVGDDKAVKWDSVREAMKANGVKSLTALDEKVDDLALWAKMIGRGGSGAKFGGRSRSYEVELFDEDTPEAERQEGPFYYVYEGRWVRGSGAEKLSFKTLDKQLLKQRMERDDYRRPDERLMSTFKRSNPSGDVLDFAWWLLDIDGYAEMPRRVREEIDVQTGYGKAMPIESVDDAMIVSRALHKPAPREDDWRRQEYDIDALGAEIISAAQGFFGGSK